MSEWPLQTLRSAGVQLIDCDHKTPVAVTHGKPYVGIPQIKDGRIDLSGVRLISEPDFKQWTRKAKPQPNDVVLSRRCNPGETAYVPHDLEFALGQNLVLLRSNGERVQQEFLRWLVRGPKWWEQVQQFINVGAVFDSLKCREIPEFELPIPSEEEQRRIAEILTSLDEKIELNRKQNRTLEDIAQALFKRWFVEFEFPDENGQPYKSSGGAMQSSELGEIPVRWEVKPLDQIAEYLNGLALQKYPPEDDEYLPVIKIREMKQGITANSDKASTKLDSKYIVDDGDVLFSWSGSLVVDIWCHGKGALNQHLFKVSSGNYPKWFYYMWTKYHLRAFQAIAAGKATTMGHIQRTHLSEALTVCPPGDSIPMINKIFEPLIDKIISNRIELRTLAKTRETLLPKLMSGELRVA